MQNNKVNIQYILLFVNHKIVKYDATCGQKGAF